MSDSTKAHSTESNTPKNSDGTAYLIQETESITDAVVRAVSTEKETSPTEIEPLYSAIDTDALDALFAPHMNGDPRSGSGTVSFQYSECDIRVTHNREVIIKKRETE